jgi:hypothetical protein
LTAQSVLLCQSHAQGANHFRLSGYKSSNTEKLSGFAPHKVVIAIEKTFNTTMFRSPCARFDLRAAPRRVS